MLTPSLGMISRRAGRAGGALTPAEQHALQRSTPLSSAEFQAVGQLLENGDLPLRHLLRQR